MKFNIVFLLLFTFVLASCGEDDSLMTREVPATEDIDSEDGKVNERGSTKKEGANEVDDEDPQVEDDRAVAGPQNPELPVKKPRQGPGADKNKTKPKPGKVVRQKPPVKKETPPKASKKKPQMTSLINKVIRSGVPSRAAMSAFRYYDRNKRRVRNRRYMTIIDYTKHSGRRRLYLINLRTGTVRKMHVAHGQNTDRNNDGYADSFSNRNNSKKSSLGFKLTAETYYGSNGLSLRLDGLERRNSLVRRRAIVIHGAKYVSPRRRKQGRSWGCPAVSHYELRGLLARIKGGSLVYSYHARFM